MTAVAKELDSGPPTARAAKLDAEPLRALSAERETPERATWSLVGINRWIALGAALLLHATILAPLVFHFDFDPGAAPAEREIPVEVIVEPPKPPPAPPPPAAEPQPPAAPSPPLDLAPAHDAPRAASDEKTPTEGADTKSGGEKAPTPDTAQTGAKPQPDQTPQPNQAAQPDQTPKTKPTAAASTPAAKDDGGELKASDDMTTLVEPAAPQAEASDSPDKVATMIGEPMPTWSKGKAFSTFEPVPEFQFRAAPASPIGGGHAPTTYLTIVYGLVMKHLRLPDSLRLEAEHAAGAVNFIVDGNGDVIDRSVSQPSGSNSLDAAALEAVNEAAPYPAPPMGIPIGLRFTYGGGK